MTESREAALTERQRFWLEQVQSCDASGKTIAEYAAAHGLAAQAMYAGKKMLIKKGVLPRRPATRFQQVQLAADPAADREWRIQLPNGVSVAFCGAVDAATLTAVLNTAAALG
ncbi:MAG: hypothetical protein RQ750_16350 [Roseovarius sp.]|nr:hypothetical protein [Roseovarius sp.]